MHLWNDYEGVTIAGKWKLGKLLRTEGRSALFATTRENQPAVVRLTEALNDQAVLQARYRAIQAAGDKYLVRVEQFGDAEQDGTPLSYAVLEPTQESLADILAERKLDTEEAQEVATNVAGALTALHAQGLVHGAVEPENVVAAQGQIKLRSDCARPAPAPQDEELEGMVTRKSDALGLAGIVYRSLTRNRLRDGADALALPEPFASIVRNGVRGTWGVPEMQAELERHKPMAAGAPASVPEPERSAAGAAVNRPPAQSTSGRPVGERASARPSGASVESSAAIGGAPLSSRAGRDVRTVPRRQLQGVSKSRRRAVLIAAVALIVLIFAYLLFRGAGNKTAPQTAAKPSTAPAQASSPEKAPARTPAAVGAKPSPQQTAGNGEARGTWRVIAVTYNRRDQAASRAASINHQHKDLHAQVWQQPGKQRFMVILGGAMERQEAFNLRAQAIRDGLPGDVYARNYIK